MEQPSITMKNWHIMLNVWFLISYVLPDLLPYVSDEKVFHIYSIKTCILLRVMSSPSCHQSWVQSHIHSWRSCWCLLCCAISHTMHTCTACTTFLVTVCWTSGRSSTGRAAIANVVTPRRVWPQMHIPICRTTRTSFGFTRSPRMIGI
jgi:hypothetical protein